ncbi:MAG: histidine kinase [Thiobacillus sp.]|uniref:ATP-binding protein n=1 Tax=Thiobacillus sp. TaxID=924 RepID=UPI0027334EC5|nr:ATP-binding protein [Thiobacillus sp.]MDP3584842.1 histidine kinase [Thiobacillus sp.]
MALLISILVASYMQASAGLEALNQFGISSEHAHQLDDLNVLLVDTQSRARGYALTRAADDLAVYRELAAKINDTLRSIEEQNKDTPRTAELIIKAHMVSRRIDLTVQQAEKGIVLGKSWVDTSNRIMDDYKRQHNLIKTQLLTQSLEDVRRSVNGFENARISTVLLAIASLLLLVLSIAQRQKQQELLEKIQQLLTAKNDRLEREVHARTAELTNLATYLTDVREAEKLHLAREMHDELGALLTAAKLDADWIERTLPPETQALVAQRLTRLRQNLVGGITLKRRFTNDLRPALLYDLGLIEALRALIEEFRKIDEIEVDLDLPETEPELTEAVSLSLFRIVQEAFTNIRKYAQAQRVTVSLRTTANTIELTIEDDGIGFDADSPRLSRHGLAGIKHRVFTHGGQLDIHTAPGAGVKIHVTLPV